MGSEFMSRNTRRNNGSQQHRTYPTTYVYNPYNQMQSFDVVGKSPASIETQNRDVAKKMLPEGTMRVDLYGRVHFEPFPEHVFDRTRQRSEAPALEDRPDTLVQLFFGQLPYKVSDHMMIWLVEKLAESELLYIERVMQDKSRKGCMQVFVDEDDADTIIAALNKRVLFDATGIWYAQNDDEVMTLEKHCASDMNRFKGLPFRMTVVEKSTSTYVRRHKQVASPANTSMSSRRSNRSATPPPAIADDCHTEVESVVEGVVVEEPQQCLCPQCTGEAPYSSYPMMYAPQYYYTPAYYPSPYEYYAEPMPTIDAEY